MTTNRLPGFQTARLALRQRTLGDLEACLEMDRDPEVTRFIPGPWADPVAHRAFVERRIGSDFPPGMGYWSVLLAGEFIGWILLMPLDLQGPEIEIGWRFRKVSWGQGYATEAAGRVLEHGLSTLALPRIVADIDPANHGSLGVVRKLGFRREGPVLHAGHPAERYAIGPERRRS
jgi:RimJ/RimL family protein N-acetyltransferase